jgi:ubiquinone biosynthesis protein COQ4
LGLRAIAGTYHGFWARLDNRPAAIIIVTITGDKELAMLTATATSLPTSTQGATSTPSPAPAAAPQVDFDSLSRVQRWKRSAVLLRNILRDPQNTEQVLEFLSLINSGPAIKKRIDRFFTNPAGKALFDQRRAIDSRTVDLDALAALPDGTLGHAYARFLRSHGLTPEVFDGPPAGISDPRRSYLVQRMRQTHDLWHVVTGCETDPSGEVALQAFTFAQVRSPGSGFLAVFGGLRNAREARSTGVLRDVVAYYRAGKRANALPAFAWEDHWATPLSEVRTMLGLPVIPVARAA